MYLKVYRKFFYMYFFIFCIAFVLFTLLHAVAMKTGGSLSRISYSLSKIHHKIFNLCQTCQFFSSLSCPSLADSKTINLIGRECSNFEGDGWNYRDSEKNVIFFLKHPRLPLFLYGW